MQSDLVISDEVIDWGVSKAITIRVQDWANNSLVGDFRGCVVALIPYQSEDGKQNALSIANQIVAANPNYTLHLDEVLETNQRRTEMDKPIDEVISELSREQCQFILSRIGASKFAKSNDMLRALVQAHLDVEDLSESAIREVYENV